jgi:hypothetical protein
MARGSRSAGIVRTARTVRKAWPMILMAYERWQALPEEDKERYRRQAREYAARGRSALEQARARQGRGRRGSL